jgi:hypothetical protein
MSKNNSRESKPLPTYADVAALDWLELSTALRMLAGPGAQWKNSDLGNMRKVAIYAIDHKELAGKKLAGRRRVGRQFQSSWLVQPFQFFQWAADKWPERCRAIGVPIIGGFAGILPGLCFAASAHEEPQDQASLLRCLRETKQENAALKRQIEALQAEVESLRPDAEKYRGQVKRGKDNGGKRYEE